MSHEDKEKQTEHVHVPIVGCEGNVTNPILVFSVVYINEIHAKQRNLSYSNDFLCDHAQNIGIWWSRGITIGIESFIF